MASAPAAAGVGDIATQAARRRTFAIVSHPDAGKTTTGHHDFSEDTLRVMSAADCAVRKPLIEKARGTQQSIIGYRIAKECSSCGWTSET